MLLTIIPVAVFVGLLLASVVLWALFLRLGLRWAKVPDVTTKRIVLTTAIAFVLQTGLNVLFRLISPNSVGQSINFDLLNLIAAIVVPCTVISTVFKARFVQAFQAWLPTALAAAMTLAFAFLVLRPFLYDAFVVPTNGMAPTLVGRHWQGICPECGQPNYCSPRDERYGPPGPPLMICDNSHVTQPSNIDKRVRAGDRILVAKFLTPRRWDIVVFQYPVDPTKLFVKRLVGFPGEKVHIQDGSVWIDGERQTPPDSLQGVQYLSELSGWGRDLWGSVEHPALLGDDEYFVLGDYSAQTNDSRMWGRSAPGHNPFAVPESYLKGVVTHTYWPPHRWRIHR